ncbi:type II toxin-antitoxin system TacA family antitoxin [Thiomonas sp.]
MTTATLDRGRITVRVPMTVQETLEMAASLTGATLNQFVVQAALREAERIIEQERVIRLCARDAEAFLAALDKPLPPNATLKAALADYATRRNDQTGTLDWAPRPKRV